MKRTKKILDNEGMVYTTVIPQVNTKKTKKMTILKQYADHISKVAHIIAKERGTEISQERLNEDIQDMIKFQVRLIQVKRSLLFVKYKNQTKRDF